MQCLAAAAFLSRNHDLLSEATLLRIPPRSNQSLNPPKSCLGVEREERVLESVYSFIPFRFTSSTVSCSCSFPRGGAKRHRKILRDNIQGITKPVRPHLTIGPRHAAVG